MSKFPYPCYVINLDSQPDRLATFREWNADCGLQIERFPGIDGRSLDAEERHALFAFDPPSPGTLGNAASHRRMWELASETMWPHVVFEDDAVLRGDIAEALPAVIAKIGGFWDILMLGFNTNSHLRLRPGERFAGRIRFEAYPTVEHLQAHRDNRDEVHPYRLAHAFGLCGYVISPLGARKMLKECFPLQPRALLIQGYSPLVSRTFDGSLNAFYPTLNVYVCLPPLVMPPNDPKTSATLTWRPDSR